MKRWYVVFDISKQLQPVFYCKEKGLSAVMSGKFETAEEALEQASRQFYMRPSNFSCLPGRFVYENGRVVRIIYGSPQYYDLIYNGKYIVTNQPKGIVASKRVELLRSGHYREQLLKMIPRA